jgi:hypothetical protein
MKLLYKKNWSILMAAFALCIGAQSTTAIAGGKLFGDVNGDKAVDIVDALLVSQFCVANEGEGPENFNEAVADVDGSGVVDIVDALLISQYYVGLHDRFPSVDLSVLDYFPPIDTQYRGTCTSWAAAYYYGTFLKARDADLVASGGDRTVLNSVHYLFRIYSEGHFGAECTETAMKTLGQQGCASEDKYPSYEIDQYGNRIWLDSWLDIPENVPSADALTEAQGNTAGVLNKIEFPADQNEQESQIALEAMKQVLARNQPLVTRAYFRTNYWGYPTPGYAADGVLPDYIDNDVLYDNFIHEDDYWFTHTDGTEYYYFYRHTLAIVGYNDNKVYFDENFDDYRQGAFLLANSEGPYSGVTNTAGMGGFMWVAYDMFTNHEIGRYDEVDADPLWRDPCYDNTAVPTAYFHGEPVVGSVVVE